MNIYTTLEGNTISLDDFEPTIIRFIKSVKTASENPKVTVDNMLSLVYGSKNPILDHDMIPGRAMVTRQVLANPAYEILTDLIGIKEVRFGLLNIEEAHAAHTVDVPTAARQIGVTKQAIRAAIDRGDLYAIRRGGQYWLRPESVASFRVSTRGRKPSQGRPTASKISTLS